MTMYQMHHQYPLDLNLPTVEQLIQMDLIQVLAFIEMPSAVEKQSQRGVFLPKRMRGYITRNDRVPVGFSL